MSCRCEGPSLCDHGERCPFEGRERRDFTGLRWLFWGLVAFWTVVGAVVGAVVVRSCT